MRSEKRLMKKMSDIVAGKRLLFVATKDREYIRNQQEIKLLKNNSKSYKEIVFSDKSYIKRILKVWFACCRGVGKEIEIIYVGFAPQLIFPFLKRWMKKKTVIIDFFISIYDTFVCDRRYFKENSYIAKLLHKIDEITLQRCHHIIVDTQADGKYFAEEFHVPFEKMEVLYLEADSNIYNANKYAVVRDENVMSVLYFGSILPLQGIDVILEATKLLKTQEDIKFIIIGPINQKEFVQEDYPNVKFYDWLPQEKLAEQIAQVDICLAGHFNAEIGKAKRTIPGKAYIYEAMNKKMILGENVANHELFEEDERHFYVEMGNAKELAETIKELKDASQILYVTNDIKR